MKLQFLGTGAADWNIKNAPDTITKDFRRCSSALVNDDLLIDPGPHIFDFAAKNGTPDMFDNVKYIIVTHSHSDHLCANTVETLVKNTGCVILGSDAIAEKLRTSSTMFEHGEITFNSLNFDTYYNVGDYKVLPLRSNHMTENPLETTYNYVVEKSENDEPHRFFYGLDSAWINLYSWHMIRNMKIQAMIFDCTIGDVPGDYRIFEHTSIQMLEIMLQTMRANHYCAESAQVYVSHMARTLHGSHEDLEKRLKPLDVIPAYDGLTIEI